jgi:hypothetical protein
MVLLLDDARVRMAAFAWLDAQVSAPGEMLPQPLLLHGFELDGLRVPLISQKGIFKPAELAEVPLSIRTPADGPYDDAFGADELLRYRYRGTDPQHRDNVGLRLAMTRKAPLVYLHGIVEGRYLAAWPVYIVGDDPASPSASSTTPRSTATSSPSAPPPPSRSAARSSPSTTALCCATASKASTTSASGTRRALRTSPIRTSSRGGTIASGRRARMRQAQRHGRAEREDRMVRW